MAEASLFSSSSPPPFHNTAALVDFLRREADEAEKRAKRLRRQANALITQYGITAEQQKQYGKTKDKTSSNSSPFLFSADGLDRFADKYKVK